MTRLGLVTTIAGTSPDLMVLVARHGDGPPRIRTRSGAVPASVLRSVQAALEAVAEPGAEVVRLPPVARLTAGSIAVAVARDAGSEATRRAVGAVLRTVSNVPDVVVIPPDDRQLRAVAEGALFGNYRYLRYRGDRDEHSGAEQIRVLVPDDADPSARRVLTTAAALADGVGLARDLVNTAPNDLPPARMAQIAEEHFAGTKVAVKVWDDRALRRGRFGGITAVGQGSTNGPRLVRLQYRHPKATYHVALVGKGITFDSGGLSLKQPKAMEWMKADMSGAAAVLAAVGVVQRLDLPVAVTGWLAVAENMPSGSAQRPGDVITMRGGKTVEVLNTDAEGRLVLADALVEAQKASPDLIIDIATLTGAQLVALGSRVAGVMGNNDELRDGIVAAGERAGEPSWPMPLPPELRPSLDSPIADLANIGDRNGGMMTAAMFLQEFVDPKVAWAHMDIAGPSFNEGAASGYLPKGGTGFGVRTLVEFLSLRAAIDPSGRMNP